ncbi:MAG: type II secretion system F family protein [Polyangiaceae bacterium]|nr:type II secretion system F family protein [Polyangiaceae bacterium]
MPIWFWLGRVVGALGVLAIGGAIWVLVPALSRQLARYRQWLDGELAFLRSDKTSLSIILGQCGALVLALVLAAMHQYWYALLPLAGLMSVPLVMSGERQKRVNRIDQQVEGWLNALGNALHSTPSLGDAMASACAVISEPLLSEVELILKEVQLGMPFDGALECGAERVKSSTFRAAVAVLRTARRTGGNLPRALSTAASSLREMARLEGVVRTKTAEGKAQAFVIGAIPIPLYLGVRMMDPLFFRPLETTLTGHLVFAVAVVLWLAAIVAARKILLVDL